MEYPPFDYNGPYNVNATEVGMPSDRVFQNVESLPSLSEQEFRQVYRTVRGVLERHGRVGWIGSDDYYLYDDKYFDRTQKIEIGSAAIREHVVALVDDLQKLLKNYPAWRVMFIGEKADDAIIVYPTAVRIAPNVGGTRRTLTEAATSLALRSG